MIGIRTEKKLSDTASQLFSSNFSDLGSSMLDDIQREVAQGHDPLGEAFCSIRAVEDRRATGATYTPWPIVDAMLRWSKRNASPQRIVDPGAGSGRFTLRAARVFPESTIIAIESDPLAAEILRANIAAAGIGDRASIMECDYREADVPKIKGQTLFIGNPPYVRHHNITEAWKAWFFQSAAQYDIKASKLAGLHIHFWLRTLQLSSPQDTGVFITSAEWLDVNYGACLRQILARHLGGLSLHVLDPKVRPFPGTDTTGAITCFKVGEPADKLLVRSVKNVSQINGLTGGRGIPWSRLSKSERWSSLVRPQPKSKKTPTGYIELGEICRVHRGQVTGANAVWIQGEDTPDLPSNLLVPTITRARELIAAGDKLCSDSDLRRIVELPCNLDTLTEKHKALVLCFLEWAKERNADQSYIARHRQAWWSVGLRTPAPILCTYMARRPPAFVRNLCGARHINIAHGLYPRHPLSEQQLSNLAAFLQKNVGVHEGRTYAGGLTKFEPKEIERIVVPPLEQLAA